MKDELLDDAHELHCEELNLVDVQYLRGLLIGEYLRDKANGYRHGDLECGGIHQNRRILGYLNYLEDKTLGR